MKVLVDANLSPRVATVLKGAGHDTVHVYEVGLAHASDDEILAAAEPDGRLVVSSDADSGMLLAIRRAAGPSFVLIRSADGLTPDEQGQLLVDVLATAELELSRGAIVSVSRRHVRVRTLPVGGDGSEE